MQNIPLAERLRPVSISELIGQKHLIGTDAPLFKQIQQKVIPSIIFWGPPGVGKTTLANLIAKELNRPFYTLSAINSGVKDVREVIQGEEPHLNNLLTQEDLSSFKGMVDELRDTWTKKQMFRTETEARFSVLQDNRYPTKASKYWQCVREQSSYLDNLMALSFDYRRNDAKIKYFLLLLPKFKKCLGL